MTLTKQQKFDMIYDLELRLAKEELVEQHVKNMAAIDTSKKPMQTAKDIMRRNPPSSNKVDMKEKENAIAGHALHKHQRDQWHNLSEQQFKELKSLPQNSDIESFADKKQSELESLLKHQRQDIERLEKSEHPLKTEQDILYSYDALDPKIMANMKQKFDHQSIEEKELLEQSEIATRTPFKKDGLDSKTQWEFSGLETQAMRESVSKETSGFTITEEQMQAFREEYYGGRHNALETLNQHSQENGYVTQEQLNQFTIDRVESELRADNILHNSQEELSTRGEEEQQVDFNLQEHFDNAQSMSNDHSMEMER